MNSSALLNGGTSGLLNGNGVDYLNGSLLPEQLQIDSLQIDPNQPTVDAVVVPQSNFEAAVVPVESEPQVPQSSKAARAEDQEMTYDSQFPALGQPATGPSVKSAWFNNLNGGDQAAGQTSKTNRIMRVRSTKVTQSFTIPNEDRRTNFSLNSKDNSESKYCANLMQATGTQIEVYSSADGSLNFLISGKEEQVKEAKRRLSNDFLSQCTYSLSVPRENYRFILGKSGAKLQDLEKRTGAKINVPKIDSDPNESIQIKGSKDSIEKAIHEIQLICSEALSNCKETLLVDREYHPFIVGPYNETLAQLQQESGAKINVPPPSLNKNDIIITGEQSAVNKAKKLIMDIYEQKKAGCQTCSLVIKKAQHKYIIGPKGSALNEFFKTTGVSIEMPVDPESEQIVLRAEQEKLGPALSLLYEKAHYVGEAEIEVQDWIQRHLLGKKGAHFSQLKSEFPNLNVSFLSESNSIKMHGPRLEIEKAKEIFKREVDQITAQFKVKDLEVEPRYHRYIIGKAGVHINKIRDDTGAKIHMPNEGSENDKRIRIEGSEESIQKAYEMLNEIIQKAVKMEAEVTKDLVIEQRLHRQIIGSKGEKIREIRERFNVFITFPEPSIRSDRVSIRGDKENVEECHKHLSALTKQLVNDNYRLELPINKQFHRAIIGKEGSKIKKIRADTQTKIDLPSEDSVSNVIVISGKKENVERAQELIQEIEREELNLVQQDIIIPNKFHNSIIGKNGRMIRAIMQDCDNVSINFPQEGSNSDKVTIRGTKEGVAKAKKQLIDLSKDRQLNGHEEPVTCPRQFHAYFLGKSGRGGAKLYQLRNEYDVRIVVPDESELDAENTITLVGKKENALKAKKEVQELIVSLQNTIESTVQVPQKYHFNFIARKGQLIRQIEEENNNVNISFPSKNATENTETVILKGGKEFVEAAKARILEVVRDLESQITYDVEIEQIHHKHVMGARGGNLFPLEQKYNVKIKFPKKESEDTPPPETDEERRAVNTVQITGRKENCEKAAEELLSFLPITTTLEVPYEFHGSIIGQKGQFLRNLRDQFRVDVRIPPSDEQNNEITISGSKTEVEHAKEAILDRLKTLEEEKLDREARNYRQELVVPREYHNKIIGKKGATIQEIRKACQVRISLPEKRQSEFLDAEAGETEQQQQQPPPSTSSVEGDEDHSQDTIVIIGYEKNVKNAVKRITKIVRDLQSQVVAQVKVDPENYSQLIGARGKTINKIMDQFKVNIKFPRDGSDNVTIAGTDKNVEACKAHILDMVGSFEEDLTEQYRPPKGFSAFRSGRYAPSIPQSSQRQEHSHQQQQKGFFVRDAPWEQRPASNADAGNAEDFPSMKLSDADPGTPKVVWGPRSSA